MLHYFTNALQQGAMQPIALLFSFLLGTASAASSACCTLPTLGILLGYSGSREDKSRSEAIRFVIVFTVGVIISLILIGGVAGFVGKAAQSTLGNYWKLFAGIIAIVFGIITLKLFPFKFPGINRKKTESNRSVLGTTIMGILLGGGVAASSLPCNPGIFIVLGAAILQGEVVWAMLLLAAFAIGFGIPIGAILLGISLGKTFFVSKRIEFVIRIVSGVVLLGAGFYLLISL